MLLYNQNQEFIGINDEGLRLLNYTSLEELLGVCTNVADLFANQPGYIHNFKNFSWIDFLLHADIDGSSAIVHANGRVFSCQLSVSLLHLCESPTKNSYMIEMSHVKTLSGEDVKPHIITSKASPKEPLVPIVTAYQEPIITTPSVLPDHTDITPIKLSEPTILDIPESTLSTFDDSQPNDDLPFIPFKEDTSTEPLLQEDIFKDDTLENNPFKDDILKENKLLESLESLPFKEEITVPKKPQDKPMLGSAQYNAKEQEHLDHHHVDKNYKFDPQIAANELGLPVDLIEEFIGDFIQQAYDFKDDLFEASAKGDFANLHILSHKLKGVAANLRIEDAFETLGIINTSNDISEIDANLKYYYNIILKLEGKEVSTHEVTDISAETVTPEAIDDIYSFGLKQHEDQTVLVQEDDIKLDSEVQIEETPQIAFEKEYLDIDEPFSAPESSLDEEEFEEIAAVAPPTEDSFQKLGYDSALVAKSMGISPSFIEELLFDYKNDARIISNQINQAIKAFDTHACNENAAKLKGISDNLRLDKISDELAILSKTHDAQEAKKASVRLNTYLDQL
jgi:HPt (histidine-containing phosphotransfer) domain-containing protein